MFISGEKRLRIGILAIIVLSILIFFAYHQFIVRNAVYSESEQKLFQIGKNYEFQVLSEIKRYHSLSEYVALSLSKNINNPDFIKETKNLFHDLIYRNNRLQSIELVLKSQETKLDTTDVLLELMSEPSRSSFKLIKLNSGKIEENEIGEFSSTKLKVAVERANLAEQTRLLPPESIQVEGQSQTVIPVLSGIFKGQQFIGYIILYISVEWMGQSLLNDEYLEDYIEIFIASPDGKVISLNKNDILKAEPLESVCLSCKDLLGNKGKEYNVSYQNEFISLCVPWSLNDSRNYWHICLRAPTGELAGAKTYDNWFSWLLVLILLAITGLTSFLLFKKYAENWDSLIVYAQNIISGDSFDESEGNSAQLTGRVAELRRLLMRISQSLTGIYNSNKAVLKGDFSIHPGPESEYNPAIKSTKEVHDFLSSSIQKFENESRELIQIKNTTTGIEKIEAVLKTSHEDLNQLSIQIIQSLVDLLQIEMGAVFLMNSDDNAQFLEMVVSYAYSENRFQKRRFNLGESMVGACAAEKRTILLKKIPEDYLKIISGLGLASPKSILLVPLIYEERVLGVIELGSLKDFDDYKIKFTERAAVTIANTFSMAEVNIKTSELLEKTKLQTIELGIRDKKMNEALSKISELQNKTAKSEALIRAKLEAMNNTLMMVEYTTNGIVLDANYKYLNTMNYSIEDIRGIDILELLREKDRAELVKIIHSVKNGNFYEGIIRRPTRQGAEKWLMATYSPVFDENNVVQSILFFAIDISRLKNSEEQLKIKVDELTTQVQDLRNLLDPGKK